MSDAAPQPSASGGGQDPGANWSIVLTQVATAQALAAAAALHKLNAVAAPSPVGAYLVVSPGDGPAAAQAISGSVRGVPLLLLSATDLEFADGAVVGARLQAARWHDGAQVADVPAALVLSGAPDDIEGILLGRVDPATLLDTVDSRTISRWKAARILAKAARSAGRNAGGDPRG